jgi:alanyl aminopeptidase
MSVQALVRRAALAVLCAVPPVLAAETPPGRLPEGVRPVFQSIRLELDPAAAEYTGRVRAELDVRAAVSSFAFHAEQMRLTSLALTGPGGAVSVTHESDAVTTTVRAAAPLAPGRYVLEAAFANDYRTDGLGLYKVTAGGQPYLFTQLEADEARTAFPCWDEPSFKLPYQMTISVPEALTAVSNTSVESDTVAAGRRTIVFKKTPPLPSYLLALAAGSLEFVPMPGTSVPARVVTVKGASSLAGEAVRVTPPLLAALERYFGRPYPFDKLDLIAVPEYWFGAMENPGAIIYRDQFLLLDPRGASTSDRLLLIGITAHELAHMWFGDLVTMAWWDDLWLNESFASWMGDKVTGEVFPELHLAAQQLESIQHAMEIDARPSTRPIRRPVQPGDNIIAGADELAYQKGQAVLAMTEAWVGPDAFRKGVLDYLAAHEWGNATAGDLFGALGKAAGKDVRAVLEGFIAQPGVPLVSVTSVQGRQVTLAQKRFANQGGDVGASRWAVPVTLRYQDAAGPHTHAVLLGAEHATEALPGRGAIAWVHPNAGETGYYRWNVPPPMLKALAESAAANLTLSERVGLVGNLSALLDAGTMGGEQYLGLLPALARDPEPEVVGAVVTALEAVRQEFLTPDLEEPFAAYVRRTLRPALERVGMAPRAGEAQTVSTLRGRLLLALGADGQDEGVRAQAALWTKAWLADPASVDPAVAGPALQVSAVSGDRALFDQYTRRLERTEVPGQRQPIVSAIGYFRDPQLVDAALAYSLSGAMRLHEMFEVPRAVASSVRHEDRPYRFMEENFEAIKARVPEAVLAFMPQFASGCSEARLARAKAFFAQPAHRAPGTDATLVKVADAVEGCARLRAREGPAVARSLRAMLAR